jgi:hypothetical protein
MNKDFFIKIKYKVITNKIYNGKKKRDEINYKKILLQKFPKKDTIDNYFDEMGNISDLSYLKTQYNWDEIGDNWKEYLNKPKLENDDVMKIWTSSNIINIKKDPFYLAEYHDILNYTQYKNIFISGKIIKKTKLREEYKNML